VLEDEQDDGVDRARSIYGSMNHGSESFADYNVWVEDFDQRLAANKELDEINEKLSRAFDL